MLRVAADSSILSENSYVRIVALYDSSKKVAAIFLDADIEIVEAHNKRKLDTHSVTAAMLADGI